MALVGECVPGPVDRPGEDDGRMRARIAWFGATRLALGAVGLALIPVLLALCGGLGPVAGTAIVLLVFQALPGVAARRTGRLYGLQPLSAAALAALVAILADAAGGLGSPLPAFLAMLVLEAALLNGRRALAQTTAIAILALFGLAGVTLVAAGAAAADVAPLLTGFAVHGLLLAAAGALGVFALGETALRHARERQLQGQRGLISAGFGDLVTRHDGQGAVLEAGNSAQQVFGTGPSDLLGLGLLERIHLADRPLFLGALTQAVREGALATCRIRVRCEDPGSDARCRPPRFGLFEVRAQRVADSVLPTPEAVCVFRDISAQEMHESALELARRQAESASEMKSRFLATVSHELRTPLNAIIGFSEMLADDRLVPPDDDRRRDYARMINISGQHLLEVVNTLLDVSKIDSGTFQLDPEPLSVEDWVNDSIGMMQLKAEEAGVFVRAHIEPDLPRLVADRRACKQILINLLSNAVKFTPRGGHVDVDVARDGGDLVLDVADTGVGISQEDLPRVGEPFFQVRGSYDRPHEGTGLGLSVVRGLVGLHGGSLDIRSTLGEGTRVTIRLALDTRAPGPGLAGPASRVPAGSLPPVARRAARGAQASATDLERSAVRRRA